MNERIDGKNTDEGEQALSYSAFRLPFQPDWTSIHDADGRAAKMIEDAFRAAQQTVLGKERTMTEAKHTDTPMAKCGDCLYWERTIPGPLSGICRQSPHWIGRAGNDWCGQFSHRELGAAHNGIHRQWRFPTEPE